MALLVPLMAVNRVLLLEDSYKKIFERHLGGNFFWEKKVSPQTSLQKKHLFNESLALFDGN